MEKPSEKAAETTPSGEEKPASEQPAEGAPAPSEPHDDAPRAKSSKMHLTPEMKADPISKKLILWSMVFAGLAALCLGALAYTYYQKKHAHDTAPVVQEKAPEIFSQRLTEIQVVLKNEQELRAEIVAECSNKETCNFIKENPAHVRDLLIPILTAVEPGILGNVEAKQTLRKDLSDRLNTLELPGKVIQVLFTNFSIEGEAREPKPAKKTNGH